MCMNNDTAGNKQLSLIVLYYNDVYIQETLGTIMRLYSSIMNYRYTLEDN